MLSRAGLLVVSVPDGPRKAGRESLAVRDALERAGLLRPTSEGGGNAG